MTAERWLVKVRRYGGGESVMSSHGNKDMAQDHVDTYNLMYQTDAAYVELYDPQKLEWPA